MKINFGRPWGIFYLRLFVLFSFLFFNLSDILIIFVSFFFLHFSMFLSFFVALIFYVWIENRRLKFCLLTSRFFLFFRKKRNISEPWNQRKLPDSCRKRKRKWRLGKKKRLWIISGFFFYGAVVVCFLNFLIIYFYLNRLDVEFSFKEFFYFIYRSVFIHFLLIFLNFYNSFFVGGAQALYLENLKKQSPTTLSSISKKCYH